MTITTMHLKLALLLICLLCLPATATGQVSVLMHHNDPGQSGQNLNETLLTTTNVNVNTFGKLFSRGVDGAIYAQPLYVGGLNIQGITRNVVYVATEHNGVFAFDADDPNASTPLWQVNLGTPVPSADVCDLNPGDPYCPYLDIIPEIGITSTPVIDAPTSSGTMYVVAKTKDTSTSSYHFFLHALDITSGAEKFGGPVEITGQVPGTGTGSSNGAIIFDPVEQNNRPGLTLQNGVLYLAFGSVGDVGTFQGWVFGYNATTLQQAAIFNTVPDGTGAGVWMTGQAPIGDGSGHLFFMSGNGTFDVNIGGPDYGDSVIKLAIGAGGFSVADYFTPFNQQQMNTDDADLGSGGVLRIPGTNLIAGGGKDGILRLINMTNMGKYQTGSNADVQEFQVNPAPFGATLGLGSPIYWSSPNFGPVIYVWGAGDYLKAFAFSGGKFQTSPVSQSTFQGVKGYSNVVPLSLSANGSQAGTGIVWASSPYIGDSNQQVVQGILRAFDATDLTKELWNSRQNAARDDVGSYAKFTPPTIANGKVYQATFSGTLLVYGLNPPSSSTSATFAQVGASAVPPAQIIAVTLPNPQTQGNTNIVVAGWNDATSSIQSIVDSSGNSYLKAFGPTRSTDLSQSIYYAKSIAGGNNTVTVTFNQTANYPDIRVLEYSGLDPVSPFDVAAGGIGNNATSVSGPVITTQANELLVGGNTVFTSTTGAGPGFTTRIITTPDGDIAEDMIAPVVGSYNASAPLSSAGSWVMQLAAFKTKTATTAPTVGSVTPPSGPTSGGTRVTISGTNFQSGATVSFGGTPATAVTWVNSSSIAATTPSHAAGAVNVVVTNPDSQSASLIGGFTYSSFPPPTVSSVSPSSGPTAGGTPVTITGTGFLSEAAVQFGGSDATSGTLVSGTTLTATTPPLPAGAVDVTVTNPDNQSGTLSSGFTYTAPPPTVSGVSPVSGPTGGGTVVTISGTGFISGAAVSFGGSPATVVTFVSSSTLTATTPPHAAGAVNVVISNPDGQAATLTNGFGYVAGGISFVQVAAAVPSSAQVVTVNYPRSQLAGDLNVIVVGWNDTSSTVQSVTDSRGNSYLLAIGPTSGTGVRQSIYYARNVPAGANTVTVTFNKAATFPDIRILEYSGVTTLDRTAGASGSSKTSSSGSATTTSATELIVGANTVATATTGPGANFTSRIITSPDGDIAEDRTVSATGSYSATAPLAPSGPWVMQMVTFK